MTRVTPVIDRVAARFGISEDGCWEWTGGTNAGGYGVLNIAKRPRLVYRVLYELVVGPVPDALELDHLCRNRRCVNPDHLEPVTHRENVLRGDAPSARAHRENICKRGHEFTPDNTYWFGPDKRHRQCQACNRLREARRVRR